LSVVIVIFTWLYDNYRIVDLPLRSTWTWLFSILLVEFVYYWTHRALHEFNILWAAHQFHHMAEDVNISTTIRDSIVDLVIYDVSFKAFLIFTKLL
jgi:alkylglycerol monooxygenase